MTVDAHFDMRNLASPGPPPGSCSVAGCAAPMRKADSQWGELPYCPAHRLRIHGKTATSVYYDGRDRTSKRNAALRNVQFERDYFQRHILGNAAKADTHRICNETSEDALTWNMFSRLASGGLLSALLNTLTQSSLNADPELYLWGLSVRLDDASSPLWFSALKYARGIFEKA